MSGEETKKKKSLFYDAGGFSLIETFVAISVLLFAVTGVLTITQQSLKSASLSKDRLIAVNLAQEAIEFVRNKKDENIMKDGWGNWFSGGTTNLQQCVTERCFVDVHSDQLERCSGQCDPLTYDDASGRYGQSSSWEDTRFTRTVSIRQLSPDREARVTVTVSWPVGLRTEEVVLEENMLPWRD